MTNQCLKPKFASGERERERSNHIQHTGVCFRYVTYVLVVHSFYMHVIDAVRCDCKIPGTLYSLDVSMSITYPGLGLKQYMYVRMYMYLVWD